MPWLIGVALNPSRESMSKNSKISWKQRKLAWQIQVAWRKNLEGLLIISTKKRKSQGLKMFFPIYFYPKLYILIRNPVQWIERLPIRIMAILCQNIPNLEHGARVTFLVSILHVSYFKNPLSSKPIGTAGHPSWVGELRMAHTEKMGAQAGLRTEQRALAENGLRVTTTLCTCDPSNSGLCAWWDSSSTSRMGFQDLNDQMPRAKCRRTGRGEHTHKNPSVATAELRPRKTETSFRRSCSFFTCI